MKQEPVAWMHKESGQVFSRMGSPVKPDEFIPLYTSPQYRELSEEEILAVEKDLRYNGDFCELHFARAILSKASEK